MSTPTLAQPVPRGQEQNSTYEFLNFLFANHQKGFIEFRYFSQGPKPKIDDAPDFFPLPLDPLLLERQVLSRNGRQMITFSPAPRLRPAKKGEAGKDSDVSEIACIWADLDSDKVDGGTIEVIRRVNSLSLRPSFVVNSGFGRHVYYAFNEPLDNLKLLDWDEMIRQLRDVLGGDAVVNASRVMRLPGTLNVKSDPGVPAEICAENSSRIRYSLAEVKSFLNSSPKLVNGGKSNGKVVAKAAANGNHSRSETAPDDGSQAVAVTSPSLDTLRARGVPVKVLEAITTGKHTVRTGKNAGRDDDQSSRDFWIMLSLLERGFTEAETKAVFRNHPSGCGSKWAIKKHGETYLDDSVKIASAKVAAKKGEREKSVGFSDQSMPDNYELTSDGSIWLVGPPIKKDGEPRMTLVCDSPIRISEILENIDSGQISISISYKYLNRQRSTTILRGQMCDSRALVAALAGDGAPITSNNSRLVVSYLTAYEHAFSDSIPHKKVTSKFGRGQAGGAFFLPGLNGDVQFQPVGPGDSAIYRSYAARKGNLNEWVNAMNSLVDGKFIIPQIAVAAAFVPPLQKHLQIPNFILDMYGNTSSGKSTTLKLAASVFGRPADPESVIHQWNNTKVSVEQIAGMCSELPVYLDDAQHCPDDLKRTVIYMIANGKGKGRGAKGGGLRETMTWQTVALSTSEEPLHEASPHEGARGRLLPIGGLIPPFPVNHGGLVQKLEAAVANNHGLAGEKFIRHLNGWNEAAWKKWQNRYTHIRSDLLSKTNSDIVGRVSSYIAAIAVASEIAGPLLGLRFKADVLSTWMLNHLNAQQQNQNMVLLVQRTLADHYVSNENLFAGSTYYDPVRGNLQGAVKKGEYVGFLRTTLDAIFAKRKWNQTAILNKLSESGALTSTEADRHTKKVSIAGVKHRMVCLKWSSLLPDDSKPDDSKSDDSKPNPDSYSLVS
jgi:uncharacterized protein (DUF927 family)